jgi:hypothetical protein
MTMFDFRNFEVAQARCYLESGTSRRLRDAIRDAGIPDKVAQPLLIWLTRRDQEYRRLIEAEAAEAE